MNGREIVGWRYIETMVDGRAGFTAVIVGERGPITEKLRNGALVGRCATCRWAVAGVEVEGKHRDEFLQCTHDWTHGAIAGMDGGYCDAGHRIEVEPDFGCLHWQAKDDPAPETP